MANHDLIERYARWAVPFFVGKGVDGLIVADQTGRSKGDHESVAILNPQVIRTQKQAGQKLALDFTSNLSPGARR